MRSPGAHRGTGQRRGRAKLTGSYAAVVVAATETIGATRALQMPEEPASVCRCAAERDGRGGAAANDYFPPRCLKQACGASS
jgi:hypothetical protein